MLEEFILNGTIIVTLQDGTKVGILLSELIEHIKLVMDESKL